MPTQARSPFGPSRGLSREELRSHLVSRIDLFTLRLFLAVVEESSIARAADREHMESSAVSKRLADLEQTMHVALLERHRRGVSLTPAGQALLPHSRRLLRDLEQLEVEMGEFISHSQGARGHVRARANESALFGFFPDALSRFMSEYPNVTVDLRPDTSTGAVQAVREGAADLGIFCPQRSMRRFAGSGATNPGSATVRPAVSGPRLRVCGKSGRFRPTTDVDRRSACAIAINRSAG
jgi:molybdenum-dependent DNA-binding transcriptional regulator ModE